MHEPPCPDWRTHLQALVEALGPSDFYSLRAFCDRAMQTWDDERLIADADAALAFLRNENAA